MREASSTTPPRDGRADDYVMGRTDHEHERLRRQAQVWETATRRALTVAGLREGMCCLDVGCGPGEVLRLMRECVGAHGHVTGLDVDGPLGRDGVARLTVSGADNCAFVEGDAMTLAEMPGAPFDFVYARLVLLHADDPIALLRRLWSWTRPGGTLLVQDYDFVSLGFHPPLPMPDEFERVVLGVFHDARRDTRIGYKMPVHFVDAGVGAPDGTDTAGLLGSLSDRHMMFASVYRSVLPRALALGLTTEERAAGFLADLARIANGEQYHAAYPPLMVATWKRKPDVPDSTAR
jgi:SAM-dependent methyltransferase